MLAYKELLHRRTLRSVESKEFRKSVRDFEQPFWLRQLCWSLYDAEFDCGERPVPLLIDNPVPRASGSGIDSDYQQVPRLLGGFKKRDRFFRDVEV